MSQNQPENQNEWRNVIPISHITLKGYALTVTCSKELIQFRLHVIQNVLIWLKAYVLHVMQSKGMTKTRNQHDVGHASPENGSGKSSGTICLSPTVENVHVRAVRRRIKLFSRLNMSTETVDHTERPSVAILTPISVDAGIRKMATRFFAGIATPEVASPGYARTWRIS